MYPRTTKMTDPSCFLREEPLSFSELMQNLSAYKEQANYQDSFALLMQDPPGPSTPPEKPKQPVPQEEPINPPMPEKPSQPVPQEEPRRPGAPEHPRQPVPPEHPDKH